MVTVDIFNMSEDVWPFIAAISDTDRRNKEIEENACLGDREIWCLPDDGEGILICPKPISNKFLEHHKEVTGKRVKVWVPEVRNGQLCEDIMADERFWERLVGLGSREKQIRLVAYTTSVQFVKLVEKLRKTGAGVITPESPGENDLEVINKFGTKSGIRKYGEVPMSPGFIFESISEAVTKAAEVYRDKNGVVIKTNKGHAGMGVEIFRPGELLCEAGETEKKILEILNKDEYWNNFPIVVEELVDVDESVGGGCPNVELKVEENGKVKYLYPCGMRVSKKGEFAGIEIGRGLLGNEVVDQMKKIAIRLGNTYAKDGYRGSFEVDFVAGKDGKLLVTESNIRRTGGTHVFLLAKNLFGEDFLNKTFVLSNNWFKLSQPVSFEEIKNKIDGINFDRSTNEGVVIISENTLSLGRLGYVVFGKNRKRAEEIEAKMKKMVS